MGKEGCLCGWKGIGCVRNVPSDSHQGLLTENTRRFYSGGLYHLSYLSTQCKSLPQSNGDGRWYRPQAPVLFRVPHIQAKAGKLYYCWDGRTRHTHLFLLALLREGCHTPEAGMLCI